MRRCPRGHLERSEHGGRGCGDGLHWAKSLGRCLGGGGGGGGGCFPLLGGALQQRQLLGQAGAGFHYHIMFNLLPDPNLQVLRGQPQGHQTGIRGGESDGVGSTTPPETAPDSLVAGA